MTKHELKAKITLVMGWCPEVLTEEEERKARNFFEGTDTPPPTADEEMVERKFGFRWPAEQEDG